jgi:hypothetical protein
MGDGGSFRFQLNHDCEAEPQTVLPHGKAKATKPGLI